MEKQRKKKVSTVVSTIAKSQQFDIPNPGSPPNADAEERNVSQRAQVPLVDSK